MDHRLGLRDPDVRSGYNAFPGRAVAAGNPT
jgi:hypothetical protein